MKFIVFNDYIRVVNEMLQQFIAMKKMIKFDEMNLYKIFIRS